MNRSRLMADKESAKQAGQQKFTGPLNEMALTTNTDLWNDSCSIDELTRAIQRGAVGATTNPSIVVYVLNKEMHLWENRIRELVRDNPTASEDEIAILLNEEMAVKGAELLKPIYDKYQGKKGRLSIQTAAKYYRNTEMLLKQARRFASLADNMQIKIPVSAAGMTAIEEATYEGISINATVSFTVAQAIAVAEAVERGLKRREAEGKDIATMSPVCTIMCGRVDDWIRIVADRDNITTTPGFIDLAGVAVMKKAYEIYKQRGYRLRLLSAAYRCHSHWSEFIGGDCVVSIPFKWQERFDSSDIPCADQINTPVPEDIVDELSRKFVDFRQAYEEDGQTVEQFNSYGAQLRTLRQFIDAFNTLSSMVRDIMTPSPD